jgi:hypothetical protein
VRIAYRNFPDAPNNTVTERIFVKGPPKGSKAVLVTTKTFTFDGPSGTEEIPVAASAGHDNIDALVNWNTNGLESGVAQARLAPRRSCLGLARRSDTPGGIW